MNRIISLRRTFFLNHALFCSSQKGNQSQTPVKDSLTEAEAANELIEDNYEKVKMQGLGERNIAGTNSFQRAILTHNNFDLMHPNIHPQVASLSTTLGIQHGSSNLLAQVSLGRIKVKKENQVFLSEVDPLNIPEYYQVVFDQQKEMSLVGRQFQWNDGSAGTGEMEISVRRAFEEKSQGELSEQIVGVGVDAFMNVRLAWKQCMVALVLTYFVSYCMIETKVEEKLCLDSINEVESERMKQTEKIKRNALGQAIMTNPQMRMV